MFVRVRRHPRFCFMGHISGNMLKEVSRLLAL